MIKMTMIDSDGGGTVNNRQWEFKNGEDRCQGSHERVKACHVIRAKGAQAMTQ